MNFGKKLNSKYNLSNVVRLAVLKSCSHTFIYSSQVVHVGHEYWQYNISCPTRLLYVCCRLSISGSFPSRCLPINTCYTNFVFSDWSLNIYFSHIFALTSTLKLKICQTYLFSYDALSGLNLEKVTTSKHTFDLIKEDREAFRLKTLNLETHNFLNRNSYSYFENVGIMFSPTGAEGMTYASIVCYQTLILKNISTF